MWGVARKKFSILSGYVKNGLDIYLMSSEQPGLVEGCKVGLDCTPRLLAMNGLTSSEVWESAIDGTLLPCSSVDIYSGGDIDSKLRRGPLVAVGRGSRTDLTREHHALEFWSYEESDMDLIR